MQSILLILHVLMALSLIGLILIQHGKGADAGAAFGSGASSTVFGASGSTSFLTRATGILAFVFFANSFFLSYLSTTGVERESLMGTVEKTETMVDQKVLDTTKVEQKSDVPVAPEQTGQSDLPVIPE
ncbi:MAG: preprotein translocase subunit SecG [Gammaproteobacteria bacterium]